MKLHLVDINTDLITEWEKAFSEFENVTVQCADILTVAENTIVSPANSYGFMDGGIDRLYTDFFGLRPQTEIQQYIATREEGFLPVGAAVLVNTGHKKVPFMISAPTMMSLGAVPPSNCFYAMAAILFVADKHKKDKVTDIYCPGLATLTGRVAPDIAAVEMANAYRKWVNRGELS